MLAINRRVRLAETSPNRAYCYNLFNIGEIKLAGLAIAGQLLQVMQQLPSKGGAYLRKS